MFYPVGQVFANLGAGFLGRAQKIVQAVEQDIPELA